MCSRSSFYKLSYCGGRVVILAVLWGSYRSEALGIYTKGEVSITSLIVDPDFYRADPPNNMYLFVSRLAMGCAASLSAVFGAGGV